MRIKIHFLILFLFFYYSLHALTDRSEFAALGPEEKVDTILKDYIGNTWFIHKLDFAIKAEMIKAEKAATLPHILSLLTTCTAHPYYSDQNEFSILNAILFNEFYLSGLFTKEEMRTIADKYIQILDIYLNIYKKIDTTSMVLVDMITLYTKGKTKKRDLAYIKRIFNKYTKQGYADLIIEFDELQKNGWI